MIKFNKRKHKTHNTLNLQKDNYFEYFENLIEEIENNKPKSIIGFDNLDTYYSLMSLWKQVPDDYKKYNQVQYITNENLDDTLHPTLEGNKEWAKFLYEKINE